MIAKARPLTLSRRVTFAAPGGPEVLELGEAMLPTPAAGEVVIQVHAAGLNYSDLLQRSGRYSVKVDGPCVLGLECAGRITALGEGVDNWQVGDAVCALLPAGGYAEYVSVAACLLLPQPLCLSAVEAAALPEAACTVWSNLRDIGGLQAGHSVLIHGGAGGIGSLAIQLARQWGARVITTAGGAEKTARCLALGAHRVVDYRSEDFVEQVRGFTDGRGVDLILDNMGASYLARNLDALAMDGRLVMIGLQGGREANVPLGQMMSKRLALHTTSLRDRPLADRAAIVRGVSEDIWPWVEAGTIKPVLDRTFALEDVAAAHQYMESGVHSGKIVLEMGGGPP